MFRRMSVCVDNSLLRLEEMHSSKIQALPGIRKSELTPFLKMDSRSHAVLGSVKLKEH